MTPNPALADWKKRERDECSSVRYQVPITRMKPGEIVHSKKPWRVRRTIRCVQLWAAEMEITQIPGGWRVSGVVCLFWGRMGWDGMSWDGLDWDGIKVQARKRESTVGTVMK